MTAGNVSRSDHDELQGPLPSTVEASDGHDRADAGRRAAPQPSVPRGSRYRRAGRAETVARWTGRAAQALTVWFAVAIVLARIAPEVVDAVSRVLEWAGLGIRPSLFSLVFLALLTSGLLRRQRSALWFVIAPMMLVGVGNGVVLVTLVSWGTPDPSEPESGGVLLIAEVAAVLAACSAIVVVLLRARDGFPARRVPGAWRLALTTLVSGLVAVTLAVFLTTGWVGATGTSIQDRVEWSVRASTAVLPMDEAFTVGTHRLANAASFWSGVTLLLAATVFLRSRRHTRGLAADDEIAARSLLLDHPSDDSLGYFATRRDRSLILSPDRRSAVSYRVVGGVCLAAGDPLGHPDSWPHAVEAWCDHARRYGWVPAVLAASERGARAYQRVSLHPMRLGDEAVIDTDIFTLDGPAMRGVRHAVARPTRAGYRVQVRRQRDVGPDELRALVVLADRWRRDGPERGFSMSLGRLGDATDPRVVLVTAHDADGDVVGLLSFVPWGRRGLSLDLMRRSPDAVAGVTELMVTRLVDEGRRTGIDTISLNFAVFRESFASGERIGASPRQRLARHLLLVASRWWQLEALYRSNDKYLPQWRPRLLCFQNASQLTQIMVAVGQAEGFLPDLSRRVRGDAVPNHLSAAYPEACLVAAVERLESAATTAAIPGRRLTQQQAVRHAKLDLVRGAGMDPYPAAVGRTHTVAELTAGETADVLALTTVSVAGRLVRQRDHGGVLFADLRDGTDEIQIMFTSDRPAARVGLWREVTDAADLVSVTGEPVRSGTGQLTVHVSSWEMAAKALTPPPEKFHGFTDPQARLRQRHVDLALDDRTATTLLRRSAAVRALRSTLHEDGFVEVETPMLQRVHGGANARPFVTHINAYDTDLTLRIAPELALKKLCVGGLGRIFEIGRNFRNEGVDATHNPEFTALEVYRAYADYTDMRHLTRRLVLAAATAVHGEPVARRPDGDVVRLDVEWPVVTVHDAVAAATGEEITPGSTLRDLRGTCVRLGVVAPPEATTGALVLALYDDLVEPHTQSPTFYTDFPVETSPLTRPHRDDPRLAERWDLVAFGAEIGTGYSELIDPVDQRRRLVEQSLLAAAGDPEAMEVDEEFLAALEFAMPPTGGLGIGVDRLVMLLVGTSIRETLTFPFVRPNR